MFHLFKRLSVVKDLVLHKLDTIIINQESQNVLQPNLERLMQEQQESIKSMLLVQKPEIKQIERLVQEQQENLKSMLLVQKTEIKQLLDRQFQESIHQQPNTNSALYILVLQMAEELFDANKFAESQKFYEYALSSNPTHQNLINKIEFIKKIKKIPLDWSDPKYVSPNKAYFPTIPPLNIELSSHCNLKCPYCANATLDRDYTKMEDQLLNSAIEQSQLLDLQIVALHGVGEPLLRKDLEVILKRIRETGIWQGCLTSNCTLLTLDRMKSLHEAGVVFLYCSVDTLDPELYRKTRGGDLRKTLANVKLAASHFPNVHFVVGLMNNKAQVITPEIEREFGEIFGGLPNIKMAPYENSRFPGAAEDWRREEYIVGSDACSQPAHFFTIDATGQVALCCVDQNTDHVLGDLHKQTIFEIWYSRKNQETFRNIALGIHGCPEVCFNCVLNPTTKGIDSVDPVLYSPIFHLIDLAENCFKEGQFSKAQSLFEHALTREPYNLQIKERVKEVSAITGIRSSNEFQEFVENML